VVLDTLVWSILPGSGDYFAFLSIRVAQVMFLLVSGLWEALLESQSLRQKIHVFDKKTEKAII